jgi:D-alanyl-D-alanine carboxypeptidase
MDLTRGQDIIVTQSLTPALVAQIEEMLRRSDVPGAVTALSIDGRVTTGASGWRDGTRQASLPPDARFPIYSITKTFIAVAVLRLAADGALGLEQPVISLLPQLPGGIDPAITLRHLLSHTSGLPDYGGLAAYHDDLRRDPETPWSEGHYLDMTLARGMRFTPGEGWAYSNIGYLLLRQVLERVMNGPFREALERLVIAPAGLRETTVLTSLADMANLTPGYSSALSENDEPRDITPRYHPGWVSHGLVASTAYDLARFCDVLMGGELLPARELTQMLAPVPVPGDHPPFVRPSYGLGVMIDPDFPHGFLVGHGGGGPGFSTAAFHVRDSNGPGITSIALVNRDGTNAAMDIAFALLSAPGR